MCSKKLFMLSLLIGFQVIHAMEERDITIEEALPAEMHLYVTQFLGSTLAETLKNIASLARVDKYFNALITQNPTYIGAMLKDKFGDERLSILVNAVLNNKFQLISELLARRIIDVSEVLDVAIQEMNNALIDYLYNNNLIDNADFLKIGARRVTPLDYVLSSDLITTGSPESIAITMIEHGADPNQLIGDDQVTPLYRALMMNDANFFEQLLRNGADPHKKNKNGDSVMQYMRERQDAYEYGWFKWLLEERNFTFGEDNPTEIKLTMQRKKMQSRWAKGMLASNSNDNRNHYRMH